MLKLNENHGDYFLATTVNASARLNVEYLNRNTNHRHEKGTESYNEI